MLGQSLLASVQLAAEGTLVLLLLKRGVAGMLVPVDTQIGLGGVALQTDVALEWLLSCVHSGVTLILTFLKKIYIYIHSYINLHIYTYTYITSHARISICICIGAAF